MTAFRLENGFGSLLAYIAEQVDAYDAARAGTTSRQKYEVIYRGEPQIYDTPLLPKIFRRGLNGEFYDEAQIYQEFRRLHSEYEAQCLNDLDWLNAMQHNGVPTRLLDWTSAVPVALYFATAEDGKDGAIYFQSVWSKDSVSVRQGQGNVIYPFKHNIHELIHADGEDDVVKWCKTNFSPDTATPIKGSFLYRPKLFHNRIQNQSGLFSISMGKIIDYLSRYSRNPEVISPFIDCLADEELIRNFFNKIEVYWCLYDADYEGQLQQFRTITKDEPHKSMLMLIQKDTKKIGIYMDGFTQPLFTRAEIIRITGSVSAQPKKNPDFAINEYVSVLHYALTRSNPIIMTKVVHNIKKVLDTTAYNLLAHNIHKVVIPAEKKQALRKELSFMGINHNKLYPEPSNFFLGFLERYS